MLSNQFDMEFNLQKLEAIAQERPADAIKAAEYRKRNRNWLRMSQKIALAIRYYLRNDGMSQKDLADKMGVSAAYIAKLLKGRENLTLETISALQDAIGHELVSVPAPYAFSGIMQAMSPKLHAATCQVSTSKKYKSSQQLAGCDYFSNNAA